MTFEVVWPPPVAPLLEAVNRRVEAFQRGDAEAVLHEEAFEEAEDLWYAASDGDGVTVETAVTVAALHLSRYFAWPDEPSAERDWQIAFDLFAELFPDMPEVLPDWLREALDEHGAPDGDGPRLWALQGTALLRWTSVRYGRAALDRSVALLRRAVAAGGTGLATRLSLAHALQTDVEHGGNPALLDEAVAIDRAAVAAAVAGDDPLLAWCRSDLSTALLARFELTGRRADLDEAVSVLRAALVTPEPVFLSNLSNTLRIRFDHGGDPADLDEAVAVARAAVAAEPSAAIALSHLSNALSARYGRTGFLPDLDAAVDASRAAIAATGEDDPTRAMHLANLGEALRTRFNRTGQLPDLQEAVAAVRAAVAGAPAGDPLLRQCWSILGLALGDRFERLGDVADPDEAVTAGRAAVAAAPDGHPARGNHLSNLSGALHARFDRLGDPADLDEAVAVARAGVQCTPDGHPERAGRRYNLAIALRARFDHGARPEDLDEAVREGRAAVAAAPDGDPNRAMFLDGLSSALHSRFERARAAADLQEAIRIARAAVAALPDGHPDRAMQLSSLGGLLARHRRAGPADEAVDVIRAAVAATPPDHPDRMLWLSNLGSALADRFKVTADPGDLDEAVVATRAALEGTPAGHPDRAVRLGHLGNWLRLRFEDTGDPADLAEAVALGRAAVAATPAEHPDRAARLNELGWSARAGEDHDTALAAFREAAAVAGAPAEQRIVAGWGWGTTAAEAGDWADAADGHAAAVRLIPLGAWHGVSRGDREQRLVTWAGLAADAAACAIAAGRPEQALELLEQGRAVLWSQQLEGRTDPAALAAAAPALAARLGAVRAALDHPVTTDSDRRTELANEWDRLLAEARALPGFADFAGPPRAARLCRDLPDGTVVLVNVSQWRCDALLAGRGGVRVVALPGLTDDAAAERADAYVGALQSVDVPVRDLPPAGADARTVMERTVAATTAWLWDTVAAPVLAACGHDGPPAGGRWPRIWWCPTGPLTLLPLHAAGAVLDRVVSSYTPTVRALADAHARPQGTGDGGLLVVALPDTPGLSPLPGAGAERALLAGLVPAGRRTELTGPAATHAAVVAGLDGHDWVHAACHGTQDLAEPGTGGLLPHDWQDTGPVSITDIAGRHHPGGEFAFLSACKTAAGGVTNADEAITLAAALQYSGWRHVVATLWTVPDDTAAAIAAEVYPRLVRRGRLSPALSAEALHHAVRRQRALHPHDPSSWAPFVHIGP